MSRVMFIDGHSVAFRAFYALPQDMATSSGQPTNAVFGFVSMLTKAVSEYRPDKVMVVLDPPGKTFRESEFAEYKAQRSETPENFRDQEPLIREVLEALGLPAIQVEGFEADDVIATLASRASAAGDEVLIVTGDRDAIQLVQDPLVKVVYNRRGISDVVEFDEKKVIERYGITPSQYVEYAALRGDPSDNIPGVPGVGEKTAAKLLQKYGSIEGIYAHIQELTPKLKAAFEDNREVVERNVELMKLRRDAPILESPEETKRVPPDIAKLDELFSALEFRSLASRVKEVFGLEGVTEKRSPQLEGAFSVLDPSAYKDLVESLTSGHSEVCVSISTDPATEKCAPPRSGYLGIFDGNSCQVLQLEEIADPWEESHRKNEGFSAAVKILSSENITKNGHNLTALARALGHARLEACGFDTSVAAYLLDPGATSQPSLEKLLEEYAHVSMGEKQRSLDIQADAGRAAAEAKAVAMLVPFLRAELDKVGMLSLYQEIERPLVGILASMEATGIRLDVGYLEQLEKSFTFDARRREDEVKRLAGEDINVRSSQQLQRILFEKLKLPVAKATKTGRHSTDATALEAIRNEHPIVEEILAFRELERLRTVVRGLLDSVHSDGRIHPHYIQTSAATGRLSSENPNVQNVPVRTTLGRQIRRAFVAEKGWKLITADYSQIELRVMAHLSKDPGLLKAFSEAHDVHAETAAQVFGVSLEDVTDEMRRAAKMVNYGLSYGLEAYGLAQRLGIATNDARQIIERYFRSFPGVRRYMEDVVAKAKERGFTETIFGRRRYIPQLKSDSFQVRKMGERMAMNAPIQGSAADIIKRAMVDLEKALRSKKMRARQILQVHDEIVVEAPDAEVEVASKLLEAAMTEAVKLAVPLDVDIGAGRDWEEAKTASSQ